MKRLFRNYPTLSRFARRLCIAAVLLMVLTYSAALMKPSTESKEITNEELSRFCRKIADLERMEIAALEKHPSEGLQQALHSEQELWRFLLDPSTPYFERMAAASQGGALISTAGLPRLWKAVAELHALPTTGVACCDYRLTKDQLLQMYMKHREDSEAGTLKRNWWLLLDRVAQIFARQDAGWVSRSSPRLILGHEIFLPDKKVDYPVTSAERNHAPWVWQVNKALTILEEKTRLYYAAPDRYPLLVKTAWQWQPSNWYEGIVRAESLMYVRPRNILWLKSLVKLALEDGYAGNMASSHLDPECSDYHFKELIHTAHIVLLQKSKSTAIAGTTAYMTKHLAQQEKPYSPCPQIKPIKTATAILAIGRWAMNSKFDSWTRYYSFISPISSIVDNSPLKPNQITDIDSPELAKAVSIFEAWYSNQRTSLEQQAEIERPYLQSLASELSQQIE